MVVKFRNTISPPPPQFSLHRRAELSSNSNGTRSKYSRKNPKSSLYCEMSMGASRTGCAANGYKKGPIIRPDIRWISSFFYADPDPKNRGKLHKKTLPGSATLAKSSLEQNKIRANVRTEEVPVNDQWGITLSMIHMALPAKPVRAVKMVIMNGTSAVDWWLGINNRFSSRYLTSK
jgi:hypothetical protein